MAFCTETVLYFSLIIGFPFPRSYERQRKKFVQEAFGTNWVVQLGPNVNGFEIDLEGFVN